MIFYGLKMDVARFAAALQVRFGNDSPSTMTTRVGKSEVCCVSIATAGSLDVIVADMAMDFSLQPTNIWSENTVDLKSRRK